MALQRSRYSTVAIVFHWVIAALIVANLVIGWRMGFVKGLARFDLFQLHKSFGITILVLSLGRLGWRLANPPPPEPAGLKAWERIASLAVHWAFYGVMIVMPLTGWIMVSTSSMNIPTLLYKTIPLPYLPGLHDLAAPTKTGVNGAAGLTHETLALGAVALLALHVGAVIKHHFFDREPILLRMLPGRGSPTPSQG